MAGSGVKAAGLEESLAAAALPTGAVNYLPIRIKPATCGVSDTTQRSKTHIAAKISTREVGIKMILSRKPPTVSLPNTRSAHRRLSPPGPVTSASLGEAEARADDCSPARLIAVSGANNVGLEVPIVANNVVLKLR